MLWVMILELMIVIEIVECVIFGFKMIVVEVDKFLGCCFKEVEIMFNILVE